MKNFKVDTILSFDNYFLELKTYGVASECHLARFILILLIRMTDMFSYYQDAKSLHIKDLVFANGITMGQGPAGLREKGAAGDQVNSRGHRPAGDRRPGAR